MDADRQRLRLIVCPWRCARLGDYHLLAGRIQALVYRRIDVNNDAAAATRLSSA